MSKKQRLFSRRYDTRVADDQPLESMAVEEWDEPLPPSAMLPAPGWHPGAPKRRVPDAVIHRCAAALC
jgi:hypothetical protein